MKKYTVSFVQTELHHKTVVIEAESIDDALKQVTENVPTEVDISEFLHPIEASSFQVDGEYEIIHKYTQYDTPTRLDKIIAS